MLTHVRWVAHTYTYADNTHTHTDTHTHTCMQASVMAGFYPSVLRVQNPPPTYVKVSHL